MPQQSLALLDAWESELNATYLSLVEPPPKDIRQGCRDNWSLTPADEIR